MYTKHKTTEQTIETRPGTRDVSALEPPLLKRRDPQATQINYANLEAQGGKITKEGGVASILITLDRACTLKAMCIIPRGLTMTIVIMYRAIVIKL